MQDDWGRFWKNKVGTTREVNLLRSLTTPGGPQTTWVVLQGRGDPTKLDDHLMFSHTLVPPSLLSAGWSIWKCQDQVYFNLEWAMLISRNCEESTDTQMNCLKQRNSWAYSDVSHSTMNNLSGPHPFFLSSQFALSVFNAMRKILFSSRRIMFQKENEISRQLRQM